MTDDKYIDELVAELWALPEDIRVKALADVLRGIYDSLRPDQRARFVQIIDEHTRESLH